VQPARLLGQLGHVEEVALRGADGFGFGVPAGFDQMHGVAAIAGDSVLDVAGMAEIFLIAAALVADQAALGVLFGIGVERENQLASGRGFGVVALRGFLAFGVRFARAVAHFATGDPVRFGRLERSVMREVKLLRFGLVTRLAAFRSNVSCPSGDECGGDGGRHWRFWPGLSEGGDGEKHHQHGNEGDWPLHLCTPVEHVGHRGLTRCILLKPRREKIIDKGLCGICPNYG
jgi:hypothetical protein